MIRLAVAVVVAAVSLAATADAAVRYEFTSTSGWWRGQDGQGDHLPLGTGYAASGYLILSDDALAAGLNISLRNHLLHATPDWSALGILGMAWAVTTANGRGDLAAGLSNFAVVEDIPGTPGRLNSWVVRLNSQPNGTPTGRIYFNDSNTHMDFMLSGGASVVEWNSDALMTSCYNRGCGFTGTFAAVPEPASMALLVLPGLLLASMRRSART